SSPEDLDDVSDADFKLQLRISKRKLDMAFQMVVDDWLDDYKQDREEGLRELFNFVVQCCGCKLMTREMFTSMQNADIISHLTKEFNELQDSVSYPVVAGGSLGRRFREGLCEFVSQLVRRCQNSLLYDEFLFSSLVAFLTGLADSQVRAFRHTSTLLMRLMSAVVKVAAVVYAQVQVTHRRFQLEKTKSSHQQATERLEELQNSYNELLEHQEELDSLMNAIFKGVFVHRYRDKVPEIRALCVAEMREWLRENPGAFLNDGYLKYLGWMLHDKQPGVRVQAVLSLQKLYEEQDFIGRLELFTSRFKERLLNMVLDRDSDVAEETVRLLLLIRNMDDGLSEEECSRVYPLVFSAHRGLASVTGEFL
uniref:Cohesin subunit SA n=1 Tax=Astyanax mexicanus TaxID=7994 RepID=W5KR05_ASTMX